jgi:cytochrome P450
MRDLVEIERSLVKYGERDTLLSNLIKNSGTGGKDDKIFSDDEIIGNTFIFLVVGHESTYLPGL